MALNAVFEKIDRYLKKDNIGPLIVDVQNKDDLETIVTHYDLPQNTFICASDPAICNSDEFPSIPNLINILSKENKNFFVRELTSFYKLKGERELLQLLQEFLSLNIAGHTVIFTYQCANYLESMLKKDRRLDSRIFILDSISSDSPKIVFVRKDIDLDNSIIAFDGIHHLAKAVETDTADVIYISTDKTLNQYPNSLYVITEMKDPYEILCGKDAATSYLDENIGTVEDWLYVLNDFKMYPSWEQLISAKVGNVQNLENAISNYILHDGDRYWLWYYFVGLKLFGASNDWVLDKAIEKSDHPSELIRNIYRSILEIEPESDLFECVYEKRKIILNAVGNPIDEVVSFCKIVLCKEEKALYYLTDNSIQEKELIFKLLDKYGLDFERNELVRILKKVYPDLHNYLSPYYFKNNLLDSYFQDYKYQKIINKIFPDFMEVVNQQAINREYNVILQPRCSYIECLECSYAQTYFTDAMGVEYLGYIMAKCHDLGLMAKVTICRSELPSITSKNKEFWSVLSSEQYPIITFDKIDKIKHHGEEGYDYSRADRKLPLHLIRELELIGELLRKIKSDLAVGRYSKAILVSDHGASRLAVIHETENLWEMGSKGIHSGRCCPKNELDIRPDSAADADDFWALANYDRFKGSRKANVEVHGGATLEEVVVPIIEISYLDASVEVKIMSIDAPATFTGIPEIKVSYRKKASIKIFATQRLMDVSIEIDGHMYDSRVLDDNFYIVDEMPEIRRAKTYSVNVYACGNLIASNLPLRVTKESGSEKSIL